MPLIHITRPCGGGLGRGVVTAQRNARDKQTTHSRALTLRRNPTDAERILWRYLRGNALGVSFRRQQPVGPFIADFLCFEHRVIIEADGGQHNHNDHDAARDAYLSAHGYRVLRYWNHDILQRTEAVLQDIQRALSEATR